MILTKQKLLEIIEQELKEQSQFPGLSEPFIKALEMVQRTEPNQPYVIPKGVDADTVKALFVLKQNNQLNNVKVLQQLDKRASQSLETPEWI